MMNKTAFMMMIAASQMVFALPQTQLTAGGIALITLPEYAPNNVQVFFNNTQVPIITQQNERIAIVGIPLSINEGNNSVILQAPDFMDTLSFNVEAKA